MDIITGTVIDLDGSDTKMHTEDRKSISYNLAERKNKYKKGTCRRKRKLCRFMGYEVFTLNTHGNISTKYWVMIYSLNYQRVYTTTTNMIFKSVNKYKI